MLWHVLEKGFLPFFKILLLLSFSICNVNKIWLANSYVGGFRSSVFYFSFVHLLCICVGEKTYMGPRDWCQVVRLDDKLFYPLRNLNGSSFLPMIDKNYFCQFFLAKIAYIFKQNILHRFLKDILCV